MFLKFKTKFVVILVFGLFAAATLLSCDKAGQFEGTTWSCNNLDVLAIETFNPITEEPITLYYKVTMLTISFHKENADITARLSLENPTPYFPDNTIGRGTASYTYEKGEMRLNVNWSDGSMYLLDNGKWEGTADVKKSTMTLNKVFQQTATFTKN